MSKNPEVRAVQKDAQLARLAAKGSPDYPRIYAEQPEQVRIGQEQRAARKAQRLLKTGLEAQATTEAMAAAAGFATIALTGGK